MNSCLLVLLATLPPGQVAGKVLRVPPAPPTSTTPASAAKAPGGDEEVLKALGLATDGPGLIEFFRTRAAPPDAARIALLVRKLASQTPAERSAATAELIRAGVVAVPALREAANAVENSETAALARKCLDQVDGSGGDALPRAAARLLAEKKPDGAAAALLEYLPTADSAETVVEVETALSAVGVKNGRPDAALLKALGDESPIRRAAAAVVVCQTGRDHLGAVRPLLKDPRPMVRLRAAVGLGEAQDASAVPVIIDLLVDGAPAQQQAAESFLTDLAGEWAVVTPQAHDPLAARLRRELWTAWWRSLDGPVLLDEFRRRTPSDEERVRIEGLISKLGDAAAETRQEAAGTLVAEGPAAVGLLRRAVASNADPRGAAQAAHCLQQIENNRPTPLPNAAVRLVALRRPAGSVDALLAYLPSAENESVAGQIIELLPTLAVEDGKAAPALVAALTDKAAVRRTAAAVALTQAGLLEYRPAVLKLLKDPDPETRLATALALAGAGEATAVPVLIALAAESSDERASRAEDFLLLIAGDKAPETPAGNAAKKREAWSAWWKDNEAKIDLAGTARAARSRGWLLAIEMFNPNTGTGSVTEFDSGNKVRWQVTGLQYPMDAQVLPNGRVLVAEQNVNRISERDSTGKVLWEKSVNQPFQVQRLPNGHTFAAGRQQLIEFDRAGNEVFNINRPEYLISARKFRDGQIGVINNLLQYKRLDSTGKELKAFGLGRGNRGFSTAEVLPNDHVLVADQQAGRVIEYGSDGKVIWEAEVPQPAGLTRLANGQTLVGRYNSAQVTVLDRGGRVIAVRKNFPVQVFRAYQR